MHDPWLLSLPDSKAYDKPASKVYDGQTVYSCVEMSLYII